MATLSLKTIDGVPQLSLAVALPVTLESVDAAMPSRSARQLAPPAGAMHATVTSAGQVITGASLSTTVTVWLQLEALPQSSVAVHVRVMTLSCAQVPPATLSLSVTVTSLSQLSVALALPVPAELLSSSQSTVTSAGQVMVGAVLSTTVMT